MLSAVLGAWYNGNLCSQRPLLGHINDGMPDEGSPAAGNDDFRLDVGSCVVIIGPLKAWLDDEPACIVLTSDGSVGWLYEREIGPITDERQS